MALGWVAGNNAEVVTTRGGHGDGKDGVVVTNSNEQW